MAMASMAMDTRLFRSSERFAGAELSRTALERLWRDESGHDRCEYAGHNRERAALRHLDQVELTRVASPSGR